MKRALHHIHFHVGVREKNQKGIIRKRGKDEEEDGGKDEEDGRKVDQERNRLTISNTAI